MDAQRAKLFSVATYNVHMWMDPFDNEGEAPDEISDSVDRILQVINKERPDVLLLQEFAPADFHFNNRLVRAGKTISALQAMGYIKQVFCNIVPSWLESPVGNAIFIKADALDAEFCGNGLKICKGLAEEIRTLPKAPITSLNQGIHEGQQETRCYASVRLRVANQTFIIVTTHLDIAAESQRLFQLKAILAHVADQIQLAKKENEALRERNLLNRDYSFAEPVVIIAGDFNTVDPEDIDAVADEREREKLTEMLNAVNNKEATFIDLVKDPSSGVCAYLTTREHHETPGTEFLPAVDSYRYRSVRVRGHTNWNLTKIDHVFVGQPAAHPPVATTGYIHPEPSSDHLMLVAYIEVQPTHLPHFDEYLQYPARAEELKAKNVPSTIQQTVNENPFARDAIEVDPVTGITYYYPQIYSRKFGKTKRQTKCIPLAPMLIPKDFGNWNQPAYSPWGQAKLVQNSRRIRTNSKVFADHPAPFGDIVRGAAPIEIFRSRAPKDTPVYFLVSKTRGVFFTRPFVSRNDQRQINNLKALESIFADKEPELFVLTAAHMARMMNKFSVHTRTGLAQTSMSFVPDTEAYIIKNVEWEVLDFRGAPTDRVKMLADASSLPITNAEIDTLITTLMQDRSRERCRGYLPLSPHFVEAEFSTEHRVQHGESLFDKMHRQVYLFPLNLNFGEKPSRYPDFTTASYFERAYLKSLKDVMLKNTQFLDLNAKLRRWELRASSLSPPDLVRATDAEFARWFVCRSFAGHGDDVYQVAQGAVQFLVSDINSSFMSTYNTTCQRALENKQPNMAAFKFDNPLEALRVFAPKTDDRETDFLNSLDPRTRLTGKGTYFYKAIDFARIESRPMIDYLAGWIQMDWLQTEMIQNAIDLGDVVLFNESPEYIANTDRELTLKTPIHTVHVPKEGPQYRDYTVGHSWSNVVYVSGMKVYPLELYHVIPPLQRVRQTYEGYADCIDPALDVQVKSVRKLHRKHFTNITATDTNNPPSRISWKLFRFLAESDTANAHLDRLEAKLERISSTGRKDRWFPDFGDGRVLDALAAILEMPHKEIVDIFIRQLRQDDLTLMSACM